MACKNANKHQEVAKNGKARNTENGGEPQATKASEDCFSHVIYAGLSSVDEAVAVNSDSRFVAGGSVAVDFTANY